MTIIYRDIQNLNKLKKDLTDYVDVELEKDPLEYKKPLKNGEILTDKEDKDLYKSLRTIVSGNGLYRILNRSNVYIGRKPI